MNNINIALCISGTKLRQAGFAPLVSIGVISEDEEKQLDRTTLIAGKPVYVLKHTPDCIIYEAIDRKVKPFDRDTPGVLSIGLAIPARCQLAGGKSPYTLLKEIYDTFVSEYMAPVNDGRHSYLDKYADDTVFRKILDIYPLESRETNYVTMDQNPTGLTATLCLPESKIEEFFRDSQYNEFSRFKDIEIGFDCPTTAGLENLEIPRPKRYDVFVNGRPTNKFMTDPNDFYTTGEPNTDSYTYNNISFCLKHLLDSPDNRYQEGNSYAVLDKLKNRIDCKVGYEERKYVCHIKVSGAPKNVEEQVLSYVKSGQIAITIDGREFASFREPDDKFRLPYSYFNKIASVRPSNNVKIDGYKIGGAARLEWDPKRPEAYIDIKLTQAFAAQPTRDYGYTNYPPTKKPQKPNAYNQTDGKPSYQDPSDVGNSRSGNSNPRKTWVAILALVAVFLLGGIVGRVVFPVKNDAESARIKTLIDSCNMFEKQYRELKSRVDEAKAQAEAEAQAKAQAEAEAEAEAKAEAAKAKAEAAKAKAEAKREEVRKQILALVKNKDIIGCRALWDKPENKRCLTPNEIGAIEVVLAYNPKAPKGMKFDNLSVLKKEVQKYLETEGSFNDYQSIENARNKIIEIENKHVVKK